MSADTTITKNELIVTSCGCGNDGKRIVKGCVEICDATTTTMADIRSLIVDEFDQDMLPKESDWAFFVDGVRLGLKQEKRKLACDYLYKEIRIESKSAIPTIAKQQQQEQVNNNISKKPPIVSTTTSTAATNATTPEQTEKGKEEVAAVKMPICLDVDEKEQVSEIQRTTTKRNPRYQNEKVAPVTPPPPPAAAAAAAAAAPALSSREQPETIELSSDSETEDSSIKLNCCVSLIRHRQKKRQAAEKAKQDDRKVAPRKSIARGYRAYSEEPRTEMQSGRHAEDAIECYSSDDDKTKEGGVRDNEGVDDGRWTQKDMDGSEGSKKQSMNPPTNDDLISDREMNHPTGARKRKEEDAESEAPTKITTSKKQRHRKKRKEENGLNRKISDNEMDSPMNEDNEVRMEEEEEDALPPGKRYELSRIAIGSRVETERCRAVFNKKDQILTLAFQYSGISQLIPIPLTASNFVCAKCFSRRTTTKIRTKILEEAEGWVAFSIKKDDSCGQLGRAFRMYNPKANDNKKKYIVLEFPNYADMESIQVDLGLTFNDKIEIISLINRIEECSASLIDHRLQQKAKKAVQSLDKELKLEAKRKVGAKLIADEGMSDNSSSSDEDDEGEGDDDEENLSATRTKKATDHSFLSESSPGSCFAAAAQQQPTLRAEPQEINPRPSGKVVSPGHIGPGQAASDAKESQVDSHEAVIRPNNITNCRNGDDAMPSGLKEGSSIATATTTALHQKDDSSKIKIVVLGGRYDRHLGDFYRYVERDGEVYCEVGLEINGYLTVHIIKEDYIFPRQDVQLTNNDKLVAGHRCWGKKADNTPDKNRTGVIREIVGQSMSRVVWDGGAVEPHAIPWGTMFPYVVHAIKGGVPTPVLF